MLAGGADGWVELVAEPGGVSGQHHDPGGQGGGPGRAGQPPGRGTRPDLPGRGCGRRLAARPDQHPRRQRRAERDDDGDLVRGLIRGVGEQVQHHVQDDRHGEHLVHQADAEEPARDTRQGPADHEHAGHVQERESEPDAAEPGVVRAEYLQYLPRGRSVVVQVAPGGEVERRPVHHVAAHGAEHVVGHPGEHGRGDRRGTERQIEPGRGDPVSPAAAALDQAPEDACRADRAQRSPPPPRT